MSQDSISALAKMEVLCGLGPPYPHDKSCQCRGSGMEPLFPWARKKCRSYRPPCPHGDDDCPGWREAGLAEIDMEDIVCSMKLIQKNLDIPSKQIMVDDLLAGMKERAS